MRWRGGTGGGEVLPHSRVARARSIEPTAHESTSSEASLNKKINYFIFILFLFYFLFCFIVLLVFFFCFFEDIPKIQVARRSMEGRQDQAHKTHHSSCTTSKNTRGGRGEEKRREEKEERDGGERRIRVSARTRGIATWSSSPSS